ncbi:hypothetical protein D9M71_569950 [compost metagenome]
MDLGDASGERRHHVAVAGLRLGQRTGALGLAHLGGGHRHFQVAHRIQLAQVALGFEVLPGHGQLGIGDPRTGLRLGAVELGEHGVLRHRLAERRAQLAEGAAHLAGQGGFEVRRQQHADRPRLFHAAGEGGFFGLRGRGGED